MKIPYYLTVVVLVGTFLTSCSNKYEDAISNYVQTIEGTKVDLGFKLKEAKEVKQITVADSISILNFDSEATTKNKISQTEAEITKLQESLVLEQTKAGVRSKTLTDAFIKAIDIKQVQLDSLKTVKPTPIAKYEGRKATDVLAIVVEAKYTVKNPLLDDNQSELTNQFILTPDGKICLGELGAPLVPALPEE